MSQVGPAAELTSSRCSATFRKRIAASAPLQRPRRAVARAGSAAERSEIESGLDGPVCDCAGVGVEVGLVDGGVRAVELGDDLVERRILAEVAPDHRGVAAAGMCESKRLAVSTEPCRPTVGGSSSGSIGGRCRGRSWTSRGRCRPSSAPIVCASLLELEEQRFAVATLDQDDEAPCAHAADPDDL